MIIGISGNIGAGKGTVVEYLVEHKGFRHYSARALLSEELTRRGMELSRENMWNLANEWRALSAGYIPNALIKTASEHQGNAVVEALRSVNEVKTLREYPNTYLFGIDADVRLRYERAVARKSSTDNISFEEFVRQEQEETKSDDPNIGNSVKCIQLADYIFMNNGTKEELFAQVEKAIQDIEKSSAK